MNGDVDQAKKFLLNSYKYLSLDDKRNEFSKELITLVSIINNYNELLGLTEIKDAYNYKQKIDLSKSEEEVLDYSYEDIINIKSGLITLLAKLLEEKQDK